MDKLMIYIPTYKRVDYQFSVKSLPVEWQRRAVLVCPADERKQHASNFPKLYGIETPPTKDIAQTRAWIFRHAKSEKIIMLDDDLLFSIRIHRPKSLAGAHVVGREHVAAWEALKKKSPGIHKLHNLTARDERMGYIFKTVEKTLDTYRHMGLSERFMNNVKPVEFTKNTKLLHALAFHVPTVLEHVKLGWTKWYEDVDLTIQMLLAGFENVCWNWACVNEARGWNASGGCSSYRTEEDAKPYAYGLEKRYPGIARVWVRHNKEDGTEQYRHVINWKRAIAQGLGSDLI